MIVQVAAVGEIASAIAADVVSFRDRTRAISPDIVRHNAVTYYGCVDAADRPVCRIPSDRAVADRNGVRARGPYCPKGADRLSCFAAVNAVPAERAVDDRQVTAFVGDSPSGREA